MIVDFDGCETIDDLIRRVEETVDRYGALKLRRLVDNKVAEGIERDAEHQYNQGFDDGYTEAGKDLKKEDRARRLAEAITLCPNLSLLAQEVYVHLGDEAAEQVRRLTRIETEAAYNKGVRDGVEGRK